MRKFKRNKKSKINKIYSHDKLLKLIINNELRLFNKDYNEAINNPNWLTDYYFENESQYNNWYTYTNKLIRKHYYSWYITKNEAKRIVSWINFEFGLYCPYLHNNYEN